MIAHKIIKEAFRKSEELCSLFDCQRIYGEENFRLVGLLLNACMCAVVN